jgi:hypothetical protein
MEYIAILVILLITFSFVLIPNNWDKPNKEKRKHTNTKYILPKEFWFEYNEMLQAIYDMSEGSAKVVFFRINKFSEKYCRHYFNNTYDEKMTHLINKYNEKINYFHNRKNK